MRVWLACSSVLLLWAAPVSIDRAAAAAGTSATAEFVSTTLQVGGPNLLAACSIDDQHVLAKFDVAVTSATATNTSNYSLASFGTINSASMVDTNLVRLNVTSVLAPGEIETLSVTGVADSAGGTPMGAVQSKSFHFGVLSIGEVQAPDPQALADSCADRSRFAGPGESPGLLVTIVGVPVGPYDNFTRAVMCDTSGATPRGGLFVNCPDLQVYSGVVCRFTGRIVERGGETMLKAVTRSESLYVTSRAESEFLSHPTSPSAVNLNACDAAQGLETGEDYEGRLVRLDGVRIWRADPARELFVVGPPGDPSDTVGMLNINPDTHYPYDVGRDLNLTGTVVHRDGRFMIAPRGHGDIGLLSPDVVFHGLPHWIFGPGEATVVGAVPNDTLKITGMAGDGRDAVRVGLAAGTNSWAVSLNVTPDTPGLPNDRVGFDVSYKEKQGDPDLKMLTSERELIEKTKNLAHGVVRARRTQEQDTQDVKDRCDKSEQARSRKKAKSEMGGGRIIRDGGTVGEEDFDATQDTTFFWESESTPGVSPMFRTMQLRVVNERPVLDLFWPQDVQLTITKNEQTTSAIGDRFQLQQVQGPCLIESLTDVTFSFWNATSAAIWGEGASATADVGDGPRGPLVGLRCVNNPVVGKARLELSLSAPGRAEVELFDVAGRRLHRWTIPGAQPGTRTLVWDPSHLDRPAPSGVVFARASVGGATWTTKFVFLR